MTCLSTVTRPPILPVDSGWTATSSLNRDGQRFVLATSGMICCDAPLLAGQA